MTPAEQPKRSEVIAPADWRSIDFLSDLHLQRADSATFQAFEQHLLHSPADAIFILGDLFDAWVGDDAMADPFEHHCMAILRRSSQRRFTAFMHGNRDFLVGSDYLNACGVTALEDPTLLQAFGHRILLTHGDAWCLSDTSYQRYRTQVRSPAWQAAVLGQPIEDRRALAAKIRATSEAQRNSAAPDFWADVDAPTALAHLRASSAHTLIHGHTHRPCHEALAAGFSRWVLSDWELDSAPQRAEILRLTEAGFERRPPDTQNSHY